MDGGAWWATVHGVAKSQRLSRRAKTLFPLSLLVNVSSRVEPEGNFLASQADDHFPFKSLPDLPLPSSESESEVARSCLTLCDPVDCTRPLGPWDSPGENTGVGCHFLLQGIFPTQGLNPGLLNCRQTLYHLNHQGSRNTYFTHFHSLSLLLTYLSSLLGSGILKSTK